MIPTIMISTVLLGIWGSSDGLSLSTLPTLSSPPETPALTKSIKIGSTGRQVKRGNEPLEGSLQYFAQRESSKPPGESHSGRASSSPAGKIPESKRESGRSLDLSEHPSTPETESPAQQRPEESKVTPKKEENPLGGERKSQPPFKRRGGVVQ